MNDEATGSGHRRAWDLIPWVVNGTADDAQRRLVAEHLAGCADCRAELDFHRLLLDRMRDASPEPHDCEPALARLRGRIERDQRGSSVVADPAANSAPAVGERRSRRWRWTTGLAAAVVLQTVAIGTLTGIVLGRGEKSSLPPADFRTLSQAPAAPAAVSIRLVVAPGMSFGELHDLLGRNGLEIVEARGDGSILGLAPRPGQGSAKRLADTVARLRATASVVLAEPVGAAGGGPP